VRAGRIFRAFGLAVGGWVIGICLGLGTGALAAWGADAWSHYRWGVPVGLIVLVIVFWGFVAGVFLIGPVLAVAAVRRSGKARSNGDEPAETSDVLLASVGDFARRHVRLLVTLSLIGVALAVGAVGVCGGLQWAPCRAFPSHVVEGGGDFRSVLPSPDCSRFASISSIGESSTIEVLEEGSIASTRTVATHGSIPDAIAWMPDSVRLAVLSHAMARQQRAQISIISSENGLVERRVELPFTASFGADVAVSPDGAEALVASGPSMDPRDSGGEGLYRIDLLRGQVERMEVSFSGLPRHPLYLDAGHAVVVDAWNGHSSLRMIDLVSGSVATLTPVDLNVDEPIGQAANGGVLFSAFHSGSDPFVTTTNALEHPVVALVDLVNGSVRELFDAGVTSHLRMRSDGLHAVALADTCQGDCWGVELWTLDLSRYAA
jgi:hypothetical protein